MAYRDNLAYQYETAPAYNPMQPAYAPKRKAAPKQAVKPKTRTAAKTKSKLKASTVLMFTIVAIGAFMVLYRAANITMLTNEITKKEKQLTDLQAVNQQTSLEIDRSLDLKKVEEIATQKLGMRRPEKYQTVYVDLKKTDFVEHTAKSENTVWSKVTNVFSKIKEYLD